MKKSDGEKVQETKVIKQVKIHLDKYFSLGSYSAEEKALLNLKYKSDMLTKDEWNNVLQYELKKDLR
jgi:hypothetical protein